jgi:hypothetical protein
MPENWLVEIETRGRDGYVYYFEGVNQVRFYWEFGGPPRIIAIITGAGPDEWDESLPWAKGRRPEIMRRIAEAVIRQKAPGCTPEYFYDRTVIHIIAT